MEVARKRSITNKNLLKQDDNIPRSYALKERQVIVPISEVSRLLEECLMKVNVERPNAAVIAQVLLSADFRGLPWHGVELLGQYVKHIRANIVLPKQKPKVVQDYNSVAVVNGKCGLGPIIGNFCMQLAIDKAKETGIGIVLAKNSSSYGAGHFYSNQALLHGFIGFSFTNELPTVQHPNSITGCIGANCVSMSAAGVSGDSFCLDISTAAISSHKLEYCYRHNLPLGVGCAKNIQGQVTTSADEALKACNLAPIGDDESTMKGFGLSLMIDILCAVLSESYASPFLQPHRQVSKPFKLSQCFIVIDPSNFSPKFPRNLKHMLNSIRKLPTQEEESPVFIPGDREKKIGLMASKEGGIRMYESQYVCVNTLAQAFYVSPLLKKK